MEQQKGHYTNGKWQRREVVCCNKPAKYVMDSQKGSSWDKNKYPAIYFCDECYKKAIEREPKVIADFFLFKGDALCDVFKI
jgi:hypothetical protein